MLIGVIAEELLLAEAARSTELFNDADLFPSATLAVPGFLLLEGQFDSDDTFYQTVVSDGSKIILPQLVSDGDTFRNFTSSIVRVLASSLVLDVDTFYIPTVLSKVLGPSLVIDVDLYGGVKKLTQGTASINQKITIDSVFDSDIFRGPIVEISTGLNYLAPNAISADDLFLIPDLRRLIAPSLFIASDFIFAATQGSRMISAHVVDIDIFPATLINRRLLQPTTLIDDDIFIGPTVSTPGRLGLVIDNDLIYASVVVGVPALLPTDAIIDSDNFFTPSVVLTTKQLVPHFWPDVDTISVPAVQIGGQALFPTVVVDADVTYAPTEVSGPIALLPGAFSDTDNFLTPTVGTGALTSTWDSATVTAVTLSGGNLVATNTGTTSADQGAHVAAASGKTSGKFYFEGTLSTTYFAGNYGIGVGTTASTYTSMGNGGGVTGVMLYHFSGNIYANGSNTGSGIGTTGSGSVIGVAIDLDNRKIWFRKVSGTPGNWNGSGSADPATNVGGITIPAGTMVPFLTFGGTSGSSGIVHTVNFGASAFTLAAPSGFGNWTA